MKFMGQPLLTVRDYKMKKTVGTFDENGVMEVLAEDYIEKMKKQFEVYDENGSGAETNPKTRSKKGIKAGQQA